MPEQAVWWRLGSLALIAAASALQTWAMVVNPFFSPEMRLQPDRGQRLITRRRSHQGPGILQFLGFLRGYFESWQVKALSPNHRFVIALRSPYRVVETGLHVAPPEKRAQKLAREVQWDTFSGLV